ncbi:MAG: O-antigen ligase family protein [Nitrospiraceae bacterium]|nr:O-antigen ligase family protein [Nitrospiraceae bacterium]
MVKSLTVLTYLALLAGQFGFDRIGRANPLIIPERLFAAIVLTVMILPLSLSSRSTNVSPVKTSLVSVMLPLVYLITTAAWAPTEAQIQPVVVDLVCMILYSAIFILLLQWDRRAVVASLMWCLASVGTVFSLTGLAGASMNARVAAFGGGPNVYSRITVLGIVGVVWLVANKKVGTWSLFFIPIMLAATIASGSRGGMLAGIVAILIISPVVFRLHTGQLVFAVAVASVAGYFVFRLYGDALDVMIQGRIVRLTLEQGYTSGRGDLLSSAMAIYDAHPLFGDGMRAFATEYGQGFVYPHNLFAQVAAESGTLGLLLLVVLLLKSVRFVFKYRASDTTRCLAAAGAVIFTSAMFSGDYYDARFLWIFIVVLFASAGDVMSDASSVEFGSTRDSWSRQRVERAN